MNLAQKVRENPKQSFLFILAVCYAVGFFLHVLDLLGLRLQFSHMERPWQIWIVTLTIADFCTALFLVKRPRWGVIGFHLVALSQLVAYWGFQSYFGRQDFLIVFHVLTLTVYWKIVAREKRRAFEVKTTESKPS